MEVHLSHRDGLYDAECATVLAYCRLSGFKESSIVTHDLGASGLARLMAVAKGAASQHYPYLVGAGKDGGEEAPGERVTTSFGIVARLRLLGYNADHQLTAEEAADSVAFAALCEGGLAPTLLAAATGRKNGAAAATGTTSDDSSRGAAGVSSEGDHQAQLAAARRALSALSLRLGDAPFFFGEAPTYLDAVVFGHVSSIETLDGAHPLASALRIHGAKLASHARRLRQRIGQLHAAKKETLGRPSTKSEAKANIAFGVGAVVLMGLYAVLVLKIRQRLR